MHLGMSGEFRIDELARRLARSGQARSSRPRHLRDVDARHDYLQRPEAFRLHGPRVARRPGWCIPCWRGLGPEPLSDEFDAAALARACRGKRTSLKVALMDQRVVAGLGNIYVSEALHRARLSPRRRASTIATRTGAPRDSARRLASSIKAVLREAVERREAYGSRRAAASAVPRLRPRARALPPQGLPGHDQAHHAGRQVDLLLSRLPEVSIAEVDAGRASR